jgi:hypothetical protein
MFRALIATIRDKGLTPCVNDTIPQAEFHLVGTPQDMAARITKARANIKGDQKDVEFQRNLIYKKGMNVSYSGKQDKLKARSLVPTRVREILTRQRSPG